MDIPGPQTAGDGHQGPGELIREKTHQAPHDMCDMGPARLPRKDLDYRWRKGIFSAEFSRLSASGIEAPIPPFCFTHVDSAIFFCDLGLFERHLILEGNVRHLPRPAVLIKGLHIGAIGEVEGLA